ncbi:PREDICTED: serine/threonine-protein kinase B-raf-like [Priapulus caudatus]|uniref:Serine/threonine-protein kinase B-raf-like n=1 Tax=Priapulus caudatus TaxID=37621 RepID=A0ABM1ENB2_PRICU|nr:PREDICTED: serine/threonine-protein kinase B-raf-like [Priapulus caudatus]
MAAVKSPSLNGSVPNLSSSYGSSLEDVDLFEATTLQDEVRNIQSVIRLTKENLEQLNATFADAVHPPSMYLAEYEELTNKLNELQMKEQKLQEQISNGRASPVLPSLPPEPPNTPLLLSPGGSGYSFGSPKVAPRSPLRSFIRAHLPNQQRTSVSVRPGVTLREALSRALKLRKLTPEMCRVCVRGTRAWVSWDVDLTELESLEIEIELLELFAPITTRISHNFVRKTFFTLAFCDCCRKLLFHGFRCQTCGIRFHPRCGAAVPSLCEQVNVENYYRHLLAHNDKALGMGALASPSNVARSPSPSPVRRSAPQPVPRSSQTAPLAHRERSTSAPNVCINLVQPQVSLELDDQMRLQYSRESGSDVFCM